jgi:hypothetical protein
MKTVWRLLLPLAGALAAMNCGSAGARGHSHSHHAGGHVHAYSYGHLSRPLAVSSPPRDCGSAVKSGNETRDCPDTKPPVQTGIAVEPVQQSDR